MKKYQKFLNAEMVETAKFNLYVTDAVNWKNFVPMQYNEISDFCAWSMQKAFNIVCADEHQHNCWYWCNGAMVQEYYNNNAIVCRCSMFMTAKGILCIAVENADFNQVAQYVVKMK